MSAQRIAQPQHGKADEGRAGEPLHDEADGFDGKFREANPSVRQACHRIEAGAVALVLSHAAKRENGDGGIAHEEALQREEVGACS